MTTQPSQSARDAAINLLLGDKVGAGDGQTYVVRAPTVQQGIDAFARFEASIRREVGEECARTPIPMVLYCPACGHQHIDAPSEDWDNPPHRSHLCHSCGCIWRPADVPTTGVADVKTAGEADTWGWTAWPRSSLDGAVPALLAPVGVDERARELLYAEVRRDGDAPYSDSKIAEWGPSKLELQALRALTTALREQEAMREAIKAVLPSGAGTDGRPDSDVIPFYITLGELRALRSLSKDVG